MCHIVHSVNGSPEGYDRCGIIVNAKILCDLIIGSLYEGTVYTPDRLSTVCGNSGCKCHGCLLSDSHIDKLLACQITLVLGKA